MMPDISLHNVGDIVSKFTIIQIYMVKEGTILNGNL